MKKVLFKTISIASLSIMLFTGCNPKPEQQFSDSDVAKISEWNKFFGSNEKSRHPADQPICQNLADACIQKYKDVYKAPATLVDITNAYTYSVNFGSKNLSDWALDMANTNAVQIKVCFGIYTSDMVTKFPTQLATKLGRLTVFLYPVDTNGNLAVYTKPSTYTPIGPNGCGSQQTRASAPGDPANPFNLAGVEP